MIEMNLEHLTNGLVHMLAVTMSSLLSVTTSSMDTGSLVDVRNSLVTTSDGIQVVIQSESNYVESFCIS